MIQRFRIGNNLSINWLLYEDDGNIHNLEGKTLELYMTCGGFKYPVTDFTLTENALAWVFPAALQTKTGYYDLVLYERDEVRGLYSYDVSKAFCLEPKDALTNIETIIDEDATVQVRSVLTYAHITNLASVDTVEAEGGQVAVVHLTNGKTFNIPLGANGGGGSAGSSMLIFTETSEWPSSEGNYWYFNQSQLSGTPKTGDVVLFFTDYGALFAYRLTVHDNGDITAHYPEDLLLDDYQLIDTSSVRTEVEDNLSSHETAKALSANMGRELKRLIDNIPGGGGGSVTIVDNLTEGGRTKALSAEQGKVLKELIDAIPGSSSESVVQTMYSSEENPGTPDTDSGAWHPNRATQDIWIAIRFKEGLSWGEWTVLFLGEIELPYATFKSFAFTRSNDSSVAAPTGGSYASPNPTTAGWSDGIPSGTGKIWMSTRTFASDDTHSDSAWSTPREVADSEYMDYEFSTAANPGTPSKATPSSANTNPNWSNTATEGTIWMAMREVSNGLYKTGSSWMVVKIKGEDGKDGSSVKILGTKSSSSELPSDYSGDEGDGFLIDGDLWVWDGDSWVNVGPVKGEDGEDGQTPYIHIKYSNDGGLHFTGNYGEDPGDYIGLYWDYTAEDSASVGDYVWKYWKGEDGFGYEYIFKLTTNGTAPTLPSSSPNTDDYVPTGWTDNPGLDPTTTETYKWCWEAWRKKEGGVWGAWNGPRLHSHYGDDGARGQAQFKSIVFKRSASQPSTPGNGTTPGSSNYGGTFSNPVPYGWSDGIPAPSTLSDPDSLENTLWMTSRIFTDDAQSPQEASWKTPVRATDTDDIEVEFAYMQTNDATPDTPTDANRHGGSGTQVWFDPVDDKYDGSVLRDFTQMYWMAIRHKINGVEVGAWAILRIKGENGADGVDGKDAKPVRIRKWTDIADQSLSGNQRVFSGYEDGAPFRDVIVITKDVYPSGTVYPWMDGNNALPILAVVNYSSSYETGYPGSYFTNSRLPQSGNYSNNLPANKTESASASALGTIYAVFANLGPIYTQLLVAMQAYIGSLTVDHLTTNAGNNSYITIDDGLICFYDSNGNLRIKMGQDSGDSTPVLRFYDTEGEPLYDLGPNGITQLGYSVTVPEWRATRFRYTANKLTRNSQYNPASYQAVTLYQYTDATRVTVIGNVSGGLQFYNPITKQWQNEHSPYHEKFFNADNGLFVAPTAGYYLAYSYRTDGVTASVPLYDFSASAVAALGTYFLGSMALKNVDVTTMKGTVDAWNDYDAQ